MDTRILTEMLFSSRLLLSSMSNFPLSVESSATVNVVSEKEWHDVSIRENGRNSRPAVSGISSYWDTLE